MRPGTKSIIKPAILDELARQGKTKYWLSMHPKVKSFVHPETCRRYLYGSGQASVRTVEAIMDALSLFVVGVRRKRPRRRKK